MLSHQNYDQTFVMNTDASDKSITSVLSNVDRIKENKLACVCRVLMRPEVK